MPYSEQYIQDKLTNGLEATHVMAERGEYGAPDRLMLGLEAGRRDTRDQQALHPAQAAVARAQSLQLGRSGDWLRQVQGVHAPLRLQAELRAAGRVGRLPFLRSSDVMLNTLTGREDELDFADYLGGVEAAEVGGQPHAMVERKLGLL